MTRVAIFPIDAIGHLKPVISAVAPLAGDYRFEVKGFGRAFCGNAFARACLDFEATMCEPASEDVAGDLRWKSFVRPRRDIGTTVAAVRRFRPDLVLYDVFSLYGRIAAAVLEVPAVAYQTMRGYGVLPDTFVLANGWDRDDVQAANTDYLRDFGVDLQAEGALPVLFPSRDATWVNATPRLHVPVNPLRQPLLCRLLQDSAPEAPVGLSIDWERVVPRSEGPDNADQDAALLAALDTAKAGGRRVVLFSLGTVITDFRYGTPVGGAPSGAAFLQRMLAFTSAVADRDSGLLLVAAVGDRHIAEQKQSAPTNVIVRASVPQTEILRRHADVFITHHGANSEAEAILAGVGMISLPGVGDQLSNARTAAANGVAFAPWSLEDPYGTCTEAALAHAIAWVIKNPDFRNACAGLAKEMSLAGTKRPIGDRLLALSKVRRRRMYRETIS